MKYVLGLDLGIASIGWSLIAKDEDDNFLHIKDLGVRIFSRLEDKDGKLQNQDRRNKRSLRRQRRRKTRRKEDLNNLFIEDLNVDYKKLVLKEYNNPYELKIRGLTDKLSSEEFSIILYHYMKFRGFKSSRKVEDKKNSGKLLDKIEEMRSKLGEKTISQAIYERFMSLPKNERRIHNTDNEYLLSVSRDMYLDEIEKIFDTQIKLGTTNDNFKSKFLDIYNRQRDFSEGPGRGSKFGANGGSFIEKMLGVCPFDNELRAPKKSFSAESFVLLSFLNNFRYKTSIDEKYYNQLSSDEIKLIYKLAKTKKEIKYKDIFKIISKEFFRVKGLELSKKQYSAEIRKFKEKNGLDLRSNLPIDQYELFNDYCKQVLLDKSLPVGLSSYVAIKKQFETAIKTDTENNETLKTFINDDINFDIVSNLLLKYKTDEQIYEKAVELGIHPAVINVIARLETVSETINLSTSLCQKLIPIMLEGNTYDKALEKLGYNHTNTNNIEKHQYLPEINNAMNLLNEQLTNVNVKHTLVYLRQLINAIIKNYGEISEYNIELTRELKKSYKQRREMNFDMIDNRNNNDDIKAKLLLNYSKHFKSAANIRRDDIIKYKLFIEQNGRCAYSNTQIDSNKLFDDNLYQIDHILPYSRSYDDSYTNKVLVTSKMNQDKKNRLPYEAFNKETMDKIATLVSNSSISHKKRDKLFAKEIDDDFIERNKNDSSYMAKLAKKLIEEFLKPEKCTCPSGGVTSNLKRMWGLNGNTHSYLNPDYKNINTYILKTFNIGPKKLTFDFDIKEVNQKYILEIATVDKKKDKELKASDSAINNSINFFYNHPSLLEAVLSTYIGQSIHKLFNFNIDDENSVNDSIYKEYLVTIINEIRSEIQKHKEVKDRSNHLHHALDACVIACATPKMINRITKYYQNPDDNKIIDAYTGEIKDDLSKFPLPYSDFRKDCIIRVYERDKEILLKRLNELGIYNNTLERKDVKVLFPARFPNKYKACAFTKETIFGQKHDLITKRIPVDKLTKKNIENIYDIKGSNKPIYEACKAWLDNKDNKLYPYHPTKNNPIKTVLMEVTDIPESRVKLGDKRYAENSECIGVEVYKKDDNDKLYIIPIYYLQKEKEKKGKEVIYQIMWGQGVNYDYISSKKLKNEYKKVCYLPRYTLIELELYNGGKGLCYSAGATSGMFEVYSVLGDGIDIFNSNISLTVSDRFKITISTIKSIKVRNVSLLGELN